METNSRSPSTSPFRWAEYPRASIFATDRAFVPTVTGATHQQNSSKAAQSYIAAEVKRTGRNPGTLTGISKAERAANRERAWSRGTGVE